MWGRILLRWWDRRRLKSRGWYLDLKWKLVLHVNMLKQSGAMFTLNVSWSNKYRIIKSLSQLYPQTVVYHINLTSSHWVESGIKILKRDTKTKNGGGVQPSNRHLPAKQATSSGGGLCQKHVHKNKMSKGYVYIKSDNSSAFLSLYLCFWRELFLCTSFSFCPLADVLLRHLTLTCPQWLWKWYINKIG